MISTWGCSMEIHVYNKYFEKIGLIAEDLSLLWTRRYNRPDSFQITTQVSEKTKKFLKEDNIIRLGDDNTLAYITYEEIEQAEGSYNTLVVKGMGLSHYLDRRTNWDYYYKVDTVVNHIKNLVELNITNPKIKERKFDNFILTIDKSVKESEEIAYQCDYDSNMLSVISELCDMEDLGYKVVFKNYETAELIIYKGEDKTFNQDKHLPVLFSPERENILEQRLIKEKSEFKNVLRVIGQGEEDDRFVTEVGEEKIAGYDRYEGYINAQDLDPENDGDWLSAEEYKNLLKTRGKHRIKEFKDTINYDGQVYTMGNLQYKKDFDLGDMVDIRNDSWGLNLSTRILELEEVYEQGFDLRVSFGDKLPSLASKISALEEEQKKERGSSRTITHEGLPGKPGQSGKSLEYHWNGTKLGIKREDDTSYTYMDLVGQQGKQGTPGKAGLDGKNLEYNWNGTQLGIRQQGDFNYAYMDLIGPRGIQGPEGKQGVPGKTGPPGTDANVTKDKIIKELGYTPLEKVAWNNLLDKPSVFKPEKHNHDNDYLKLIGGDLSGKLTIKGGIFDTELTGQNINIINKMAGSGGWARNLLSLRNEEEALISIGGKGSGQKLQYFYIGEKWDNNILRIYPNENLTSLYGNLKINGDSVALVEDIPTKISELTNDSKFITGVNWTDIGEKPTSFPPTSHTHSQYATNTKLQDLQDQVNELDIPEGVDLRPVYTKIDEKADKTMKDEESNNEYEIIIKNGRPFLRVVK